MLDWITPDETSSESGTVFDDESGHGLSQETFQPEDIFPQTRTGGRGRRLLCVRSRFTSIGKFECGARFFDEKVNEPVECRLFVENRVLTFQSTRPEENANRKSFNDLKLYFLNLAIPTDFIAIGVVVEVNKFSLILNNFIIDFIQDKGGKVKLLQRHVNPSKLPEGIKFKVVPLSYMTHNYLEAVRMNLMRPTCPSPLTFRNCYFLANDIVRQISHHNFGLFFEISHAQGESFYQNIKVTRNSFNRRRVWKKY
jgi:hypothetical protein